MGRKIFMLLAAVMVLTGCRTVSVSERDTEHHYLETWLSQLDSIVSRSQTVVADSSWRERFISELRSIREKTDTSRTLVVDTAGRVVKETLIINNTRETTNERYEREIEGLRHSLERMDSTMVVQSLTISRMDSLLRDHEKTETVVEQQPWYRRWWQKIKFILIGIVIGILMVLGMNIWNNFRRIAKKGIDIIHSRL